MKFDGEPVFAHSSLAQGPDSQIFEYNENTVGIGRLKVNKETMGEDKRGILSDKNFKKGDMDTDFHTEDKLADGVMDVSGLDEFEDMEKSYNDKDKQPGVSVNPFMIPFNEGELYEKEREVYTDKSVTECELPELMVCFKEGAYYDIKDICIDDGLPSLDKLLEENGELHNGGDFSLQNSDMYVNSDLTTEKVDGVASISNWRNPFVEYDCDTDVSKQFDSEKVTGNGLGDFDENINDVSDGTAIPETLNLAEEPDVGSSVDDSLYEKTMPETSNLAQESEVGNYPESSDLNGDNDRQQPDQDTNMDTNSMSLVTPVAEASNDCNEASEAPCNNKVVNGSITYDFDSSPPATSGSKEDVENSDSQPPVQPLATASTVEEMVDTATTTSGREEDSKNSDSQQPVQTLNSPCTEEEMVDNPTETSGREEDSKNTDPQQTAQTLNVSSTEEDMVDSRTASSRSFFIQHGYGESSFSAAGPLSGPISYSGAIPYSGSTSLRSDSSTTSTRSFAFPILNTEWNSSPVKMAKADRRNFRKHRGWRILCCKF